MIEAITLCRAAAGISSWTVERDGVLLTYRTTGINAVVSNSPTIVAGDVTAPTTQVRHDIISFVTAGTPETIQLNFPVTAGQVVYVAFSGGGSVILYIEVDSS